MKLHFKVQSYQTNAVNDVVGCFAGQPMNSAMSYQIDPGAMKDDRKFWHDEEYQGFRNADLELSDTQLMENIQQIQSNQNLPVSRSLTEFTTVDKKERASLPKVPTIRPLCRRLVCTLMLKWRPEPGRPTATSKRFSR